MQSLVWKEQGRLFVETGNIMSYTRPKQYRLFGICRTITCILFLLGLILTAYFISSEKNTRKREEPYGTDLQKVSQKARDKTRFHQKGKPTKYDYSPSEYNDKKCRYPFSQKMEGIFLVINFNSAFYANIPVLLQYYSPVFPNYGICGPKKSRKYKVIKINYPQREAGFYSYRCLFLIMMRHPGYKGYLFLNDDMIVNWWSFLRLNKSQVWVGSYPDFANANPIDMPAPNRWWKRANTAERCSYAFHQVEKIWDYRMKKIYYTNTNRKKLCLSTWSDIYYIPKAHMANFMKLVDIFYRHSVFLEAAIPTIISLIVERQHITVLNGIYLPEIFGDEKDYLEGGAGWQVYNRKLTFIHPYKFTGHNRTINIARFNEIVVDVSKEVLRKGCLDIVETDMESRQFKWVVKT